MNSANLDWRALVPALKWAKAHWIASGLTVGGIITAWKAARATWKGALNRYDGKVLSLMSEAARNARLEHPTSNISPLPFKIGDIAKEVKRSEAKVYKTLRRLETAGKVIEVKNGEWCFGKETPREYADRLWSQSGKGGRFNSGRFRD